MALLSFGEFIFLEEALVVSMYCKFGMQSQLLGAFPQSSETSLKSTYITGCVNFDMAAGCSSGGTIDEKTVQDMSRMAP